MEIVHLAQGEKKGRRKGAREMGGERKKGRGRLWETCLGQFLMMMLLYVTVHRIVKKKINFKGILRN